MARRSDHTRTELKEMVIAAGQNIMANEGLSKFSVRKLAREIGYTVGTLYNMFDGYNDIVLHINAATLSTMRDYISEHMESNAQGIDTIKNLATLYIRFANENYNSWNALFEFSFQQNTVLPDWYIDKIKTLFILVEIPLMPIFGEDTKAAEHTAKVLWASIHGICQLGLTGKLDAVETQSVQVLTDSLIEHYMRGLLI